jgi:hypothetical protein
MPFKLLDTVVLTRDIPEHGLRAGDLGAIVEVYSESGLEVEFVRASGDTTAVLTLSASDVRAVAATDVPAVRSA